MLVELKLEMAGGQLICDATINRALKLLVRGCLTTEVGGLTGNRSHSQQEDKAML